MAAPDRSLPVAVFDSGVGGLTVLHECLVSLPHEDFLYLGDTARFPYGDRSAGELLEFARELTGILLDRDLVYDWLWVAGSWERVGPAALKAREQAGVPELFANFEELANRQVG